MKAAQVLHLTHEPRAGRETQRPAPTMSSRRAEPRVVFCAARRQRRMATARRHRDKG